MRSMSLRRKLALRGQAEADRAKTKRFEGLARAGQVARSTVAAGDVDVPLGDLLPGMPDVVGAVEDHTTDLDYLDDGSGIEEFDQALDADDAAHQARMEALDAAVEVEAAKAEAAEALEEALKATATADGKNSIYAGMTEPVADTERPFAQGDLWYVTDVQGRMVMVRIWNGTAWAGYQFVADSILVPGSVGPTVIKDGSVVTEKLAATAIDGMTITGALIRTAPTGQRLELSLTGLQAYDADGATTASLSAADGGIDALGRIRVRPLGGPASTDPDAILTNSRLGFGGRAFNSTGWGVLAGIDYSGGELSMYNRGGSDIAFARPHIKMTNSGIEIATGGLPLQLVGGGSDIVNPAFAGDGTMRFKGDTEWANFTKAAGMVGTAKWRRYLGMIHVRINYTNIVASGAHVQLGTLPAAARPDEDTPLNASGTNGPTVTAYVATNGIIRFRVAPGTTETAPTVGGTYLPV